MDKKIIFIKTDSGESEANNLSDELFGDVKRILLLVDNESTVSEIFKRAPPSLRESINEILQELLDDGYIRDKRASAATSTKPPIKVTPPAFKLATPKLKAQEKNSSSASLTSSKKDELEQSEKKGDLDFSFISPPENKSKKEVKLSVVDKGQAETKAQAEAKSMAEVKIQADAKAQASAKVQAEIKAQADAKAQLDAMAKARKEADRVKEEQAAKIEAASRAGKLKAYEEAKERTKNEVAARTRSEAEAKLKHIDETTRIQAEQELARSRAELEASKARIEAEIRARIESEVRVKKEAEIQIKIEAEVRAKQEAEVRSKNEADARAKHEAEVRSKNEAEARAKHEAEVRSKNEAEARAKHEAEVRSKNEADARAKQEAEVRSKNEAEARAKHEAEFRAKLEAEARVKHEIDAKIQLDAEAGRVNAVKEAEKLRLELEAVKVKAEIEIRHRIEAEAWAKAEVETRIKRETEAERLREEKECAEMEVARVKAEAEIRLRAETESRLKAEVEARILAETRLKSGDRRHPSIDIEEKRLEAEQVDQAEILRQSFVESFGSSRGKLKANSPNFKLDTFSLVNTGKMPVLNLQQQKAEAMGGGGYKVKAAFEEQKTQKEAEAQQLKLEQEAARLNAEQEEDARLSEVREEARLRVMAEQDAFRLKAEHEAYRLKAEQETARIKAEAEAQKLAEQQAKQWEEAQRRAAIQATAETEHVKAEQTAAVQKLARQKAAKKNHRHLPAGKIIAGIVAFALVTMIVIPYFWPLDDYIAPLEKEISAQLNQPVRLSKIKFTLLPFPTLVLSNVTIGNTQELKVGSVVLHFNFSALFAPSKAISTLELSNVTLQGASLEKALLWLQVVGGSEKYPVARMEIIAARVNIDEIKLPVFNGKADFDTQGKFTQATIKSEDGKFAFEMHAVQKRLNLELNVHESSLPFLPNIKFNDLSVNGVLENNEIMFSDLFAHVHGGTLTGKAQLNWYNGWKLQGQINAKSLELQNAFPNFGVVGELYGDANFSMAGPIFSQISKDSRIDGTFAAKNGTINKLDIDAIARFGTRQGGTGRTNFTDMIGTFKADNRGQRLYLNKILAGAVTGSGFVEIDMKQQLSGKLAVATKGVGNGNVPLQITGTLTEPGLQLAK